MSDEIHVTSLGELLNEYRNVEPQQQTRFGFNAEGLSTPIWWAGNPDLVRQRSIAIVGTRNPSPFGAARARRLAKELSQHNIVVCSGLAKGIDTEALKSAIESDGHVIAVIGTPVNQAYPAENGRLQESIYEDHLLVSQFPPGSRVFPSNFPERNKLMAALSDGTAIIEAGDTSGTLHQAAECVRLGRWLFVAATVLADLSLEWPNKFKGYEKFRALSTTEDILSALKG